VPALYSKLYWLATGALNAETAREKKIMSKDYRRVSTAGAALLGGLLSVIFCGPVARGEEPRLSIGGYDPVAYFTDNRPVPGKPEFEYLWHKLRWHFASNEHREMFSRDPERYAPRYDGYCAMAVAQEGGAHKDTVDPKAWAIVDGKLYLVHNSYWLAQWREHAKEYIKQADADWDSVEDLPVPMIVGPPCATSPPSTKVALRDGRYWLEIAGQVARDETGNIVGKGDMRRQIEQVGKNVDTCLKAGGAAVNDILFTVSHVTAPVEFNKSADLFRHYFGPPSPQSTTVTTPQLEDPDYLVQVETFAVIR
jgi:enamine deaminase RidA (YjgF/YER057c/UK114 family)